MDVTVDAKTRRDRLEQRVRTQREIAYADVAAEFDVSEMTIRRDIEALAERGLVAKVHGGAIAIEGTTDEPGYAAKAVISAGSGGPAGRRGPLRHLAGALRTLVNVLLQPDTQVLWLPAAETSSARFAVC